VLVILGAVESREVGVCEGVPTPYPRDATVAELFEAQAAARPEAVALEFGGEALSYGELNARANRLAHWLRGQGVGPDVLVAVCLERSREMVVAVLGVLKAGGAYVPLDAEYPAARLELMLADTECGVLLTQRRLVERLPVGERVTLCLDDEWERVAVEPATNPQGVGTSAESLAYVMYTSGSTGRPKGTAIEQRGIVRLVTGATYAEHGPGEVSLQFSTMMFDASTMELWGSLLHGGRLDSTIIMEVQVEEGDRLRVKRELEGGWFQWIGMPLPALLTIQSGINQLRYATLKGIMAAKKKEIRTVAPPSDLFPSQQVVGLSLPVRSKQTRMIAGSPQEAARVLVRSLREEARAL
jgi:hypothetical protein